MDDPKETFPGDPVYLRDDKEKVTGIIFPVGTVRWLNEMRKLLESAGFHTSEEYWEWVSQVVTGTKGFQSQQVMIRFENFSIAHAKLDVTIFLSRLVPSAWYFAWDFKLDLDDLLRQTLGRYRDIGAGIEALYGYDAGSYSPPEQDLSAPSPMSTGVRSVKVGAGSYATIRLAGIPADQWSNPKFYDDNNGPQLLTGDALTAFIETTMPRVRELARDLNQRLYCPE